MAETELDRAEKRYAQARARLMALKNREATRARKLDTRRKIILGGALVDLAGRDSNAAAMLDRLIRNLAREQDRKAFDGWDAGTGAASLQSPAVAPDLSGPSGPSPGTVADAASGGAAADIPPGPGPGLGDNPHGI